MSRAFFTALLAALVVMLAWPVETEALTVQQVQEQSRSLSPSLALSVWSELAAAGEVDEDAEIDVVVGVKYSTCRLVSSKRGSCGIYGYDTDRRVECSGRVKTVQRGIKLVSDLVWNELTCELMSPAKALAERWQAR